MKSNNEILLCKNMSIKEFLISKLTLFVQKHGRNPRASDLRIWVGYPSMMMYRNCFGSFDNALVAAGLKTNSVIKNSHQDVSRQDMRNHFIAYDNLMACININIEKEINELDMNTKKEINECCKEIDSLYNKITYLQNKQNKIASSHLIKNTCIYNKGDNSKRKAKGINMCYKCGDITANGCDHHIIPRSFGGSSLKDNLVYLCNRCHDYVEIKTYELLNKHMIYDSRILKLYIKGEFPTVNEVNKLIVKSVKKRQRLY